MIEDIVLAETVEQALLEGQKPGSVFIGGGTWLLSRAGAEIADNARLVALDPLGLEYVLTQNDGCRIGAKTTLQDVVDHPGIPGVVRQAAMQTASRTIRNMATIGGELGLQAFDSALLPALYVLDAEVYGFSGDGAEICLHIEDFYADKEILLIREVHIPDVRRPAGIRCLSRTSHSRRSLVVSISALVTSPAMEGVKILVGDCVRAPMRLTKLEGVLDNRPLPAKALSLMPDIHASADYKRYMAGVFAADILTDLAEGGSERERKA